VWQPRRAARSKRPNKHTIAGIRWNPENRNFEEEQLKASYTGGIVYILILYNYNAIGAVT
jgi:hypothetical protein